MGLCWGVCGRTGSVGMGVCCIVCEYFVDLGGWWGRGRGSNPEAQGGWEDARPVCFSVMFTGSPTKQDPERDSHVVI